MSIGRFDPSTEFPTPERCAIVEIHNTPEDPSCSIARARVEPGVTTQLHRLRGVSERYVILEGEGVVEVDGVRSRVGPLDVVSIPAGAAQRITNTGTRDLTFLCVCLPRHVPECYETLGD